MTDLLSVSDAAVESVSMNVAAESLSPVRDKCLERSAARLRRRVSGPLGNAGVVGSGSGSGWKVSSPGGRRKVRRFLGGPLHLTHSEQ